MKVMGEENKSLVGTRMPLFRIWPGVELCSFSYALFSFGSFSSLRIRSVFCRMMISGFVSVVNISIPIVAVPEAMSRTQNTFHC